MIQINRVQGGAVHVLTDGVHLGGAAVADDGHAVLGVLGGNGAGQDQVGAAQGRVVGVLGGRVGDVCPEQMGRNHALDVHAGTQVGRREVAGDGFGRLHRAAQQENRPPRQFHDDQRR